MTYLVWFQFYKLETKKTKPNKKKTESNQFEPIFVQKTKPNQNWSI